MRKLLQQKSKVIWNLGKNWKLILLHKNCTSTTPLSEPERQLLVPYSTKANAFCELGRKKIGKNEPCSPQKAFAFVEHGTRRCLSSSDRGVVEGQISRLQLAHGCKELYRVVKL